MHFFSDLVFSRTMDNGWRDRLAAAVAHSGKSYRELSRACGFGPNFVSEFMAGGKAPSADRVVKLADVLGLSLSYVFTGVNISQEDEDFLRLVAQLPEDRKQHLLGFLRR